MTDVRDPEPTTLPAVAVGGRFPCVDGVRAIAALAVLLYHVVIAWLRLEGSWAWTNRLGDFGVSTFFLISGFLLYRPFVLAHFLDRDPPALRPFWRRRVLRIFPGYWLALTGGLLLGSFVLDTVGELLTAYLLVQNYRAGASLTGLGVAWTLVIEVSFYVALPFLAMALRGARREQTLTAKLRRNLVGLAVMYASAIAVRVWALAIFHPPRAEPGAWFPIGEITAWLPAYLDWFALGMLLATGSAWLACGGRLPAIATVLADRPWLCWVVAAELYWVAMQLNLPANVFDDLTATQSVGLAVVYGAVAFFVLLPVVFGDQEAGVIRAFLRSRTMVFLGTVSYGIYLWHTIVLDELNDLMDDFPVLDNLVVLLTAVTLVTVVIAWASYRFLERPMSDLGRRRRPAHGRAG